MKLFSNNFFVRTLDNGLVRIEFNTALDGVIEPNAAVYMTPDTAIFLTDALVEQMKPVRLHMEKMKIRKGLM